MGNLISNPLQSQIDEAIKNGPKLNDLFPPDGLKKIFDTNPSYQVLSNHLTKVVNRPMILYKKIQCGTENDTRCIATLLVPSGTTIIRPVRTGDSYGTFDTYFKLSDKVRIDQAIPIAIECHQDNRNIDCKSCYDKTFKYVLNELSRVPDIDTNVTSECATGIHAFDTKKEASEYII